MTDTACFACGATRPPEELLVVDYVQTGERRFVCRPLADPSPESRRFYLICFSRVPPRSIATIALAVPR